jgi:hypothetical protein
MVFLRVVVNYGALIFKKINGILFNSVVLLDVLILIHVCWFRIKFMFFLDTFLNWVFFLMLSFVWI